MDALALIYWSDFHLATKPDKVSESLQSNILDKNIIEFIPKKVNFR